MSNILDGSSRIPTSDDIKDLAITNPTVYAAHILYWRGELTWEQMLTVLVVTMAKNIDILEEQLAHAISSSGKTIGYE